MNIAVFASGGGSNFQAIIDAAQRKELAAHLSLLVGNNSKAKAFERARAANIPTLHISPSHFDTEEQYLETLLATLAEHSVDMIILAGYMKMLPPGLVQAFPNRILNIHPSLLPAFGGKGMYGMRIHEAVLAYGAKISGITVHLVDEEYDHGLILCQRPVPVEEGDDAETLAARVLKMEHDTLWRLANGLANGTITVSGKVVSGVSNAL